MKAKRVLIIQFFIIISLVANCQLLSLNPRSALSDLGLQDQQFYQYRHRSIREELDGYYLKSANGQWFAAGKFELLSIRELRRLSYAERVLPGREDQGTFSLLVGKGNSASGLPCKRTDIGAMQAKRKAFNDTFQVASTFNALEGCVRLRKVGEYVSDPTQGPRAAISCAPATILRKYYAFYNKKTNSRFWAQYQKNPNGRSKKRKADEHQIEMLQAATGEVARTTGLRPLVINGNFYFADESSGKWFSARQLREIDENFLVENICIGLHRGVQVVWGYNWVGKAPRDHRINQVFTAAINFSPRRNPYCANSKFAKNPHARSIARKILQADYEGTIRSAVLCGSERVVLTLVGGGVYKNDPKIIIDAIIKNERLIRHSGINVELVVYDANSLPQRELDRLKAMSHRLDGTISYVP